MFLIALVRPSHETCPSTVRDRLVAVQIFIESFGHHMRNVPSTIQPPTRDGISFALIVTLARLDAF